jgi:hypothetical protein
MTGGCEARQVFNVEKESKHVNPKANSINKATDWEVCKTVVASFPTLAKSCLECMLLQNTIMFALQQHCDCALTHLVPFASWFNELIYVSY